MSESFDKVFDECSSVQVWDFPNGPMNYARRLKAAHDREVAMLKAALKPVLECRIERIDGLDSPDGEFMTSSEYGVCDADGNEVDNHSISSALNAVREAQRIYREGGVA